MAKERHPHLDADHQRVVLASSTSERDTPREVQAALCAEAKVGPRACRPVAAGAVTVVFLEEVESGHDAAVRPRPSHVSRSNLEEVQAIAVVIAARIGGRELGRGFEMPASSPHLEIGEVTRPRHRHRPDHRGMAFVRWVEILGRVSPCRRRRWRWVGRHLVVVSLLREHLSAQQCSEERQNNSEHPPGHRSARYERSRHILLARVQELGGVGNITPLQRTCPISQPSSS